MINKNNYCVIMAGGVGSRFWPLSTNELPKQFIDILGTGKTFIRQTFERFLDVIPVENFIILTNIQYKEIVLRELPEINENQILCEPCRRNTAPCILYAAFRIATLNPDANMVIAPSDHLITGEADFKRVMRESISFVDGKDVLMTVGIKPSRPETGYGYIQVTEQLSGSGIVKVKTFTEKPSIDMAQQFIDCGEFLWNAGIFVWSCKAILEAFKKYQYDLYAIFESGIKYYNSSDEQAFIDSNYSNCQNISIDYAVMEHSDNVYVHIADFGWSDIGTWGSLFENSNKTAENNSIVGKNAYCYNVQDSIVRVSGNKVAIIEGLKDYIVVDNNNALLICSKDNEQKIKHYIECIK